MSWQLNGTPLHPLLVHLTVVALPAACLLAVLVPLLPRLRRWAGVGTPVLALLALVSTVLSKESGEKLEAVTPKTALLERHTSLADAMVPWAAALAALMILQWAWERWGRSRLTDRGSAGAARTVGIVLGALEVLVAIATLIWVILVGDAGAAAVWKG